MPTPVTFTHPPAAIKGIPIGEAKPITAPPRAMDIVPLAIAAMATSSSDFLSIVESFSLVLFEAWTCAQRRA
jgi:hypothetical protein